MSLLQSLQLSDNRTIGIMMISLGSFFFFIGVLMIFDRGLMALGNLLFLGYYNYLCVFYLNRGFPFLIGFQTTLAFFNPIRHPTVFIIIIYNYIIRKEFQFYYSLLELFSSFSLDIHLLDSSLKYIYPFINK